MPDYDLFGLDTRTFQQLCQALAIAELGPGVIVFGDGSDGARDAAFRGKLNYPNEVEQWDGSLIIQVKYRQLRIDDSQYAGKWVIRHLKLDLSKFKGAPTKPNSPPPKRQPPDYYLLVTNISLTPVPETGSDANVRKLLSEYAGYLGFKGYDVWDGEKIQRLLDKHRNIAISYGGYITVGDVLAQMHEYLDELQPDFMTVMADFLQSELSGPDQYARLNEAGSTVQRRSLSHVFVDLPVLNQVSGHPIDEEEDDEDGRLPSGFLGELLSIAGLRLDRKSILDREERDTFGDPDIRDTARIALIGGPGQGKTTLGQFICQLFRAALLEDRETSQISEDAAFVLQLIREWCQKDRIELPKARRFPVRIELKAFADDLAAKVCNSLLEYVAQRIDKRSGKRVDRDDLEKWLGAYPWVLVLDGLDEVPSSGNRAQVLEEIQQFDAQCATRKADVLIIATSRPQAYSDAFSSKFYWHRYLAPLSVQRAMHYANQLVQVCHRDDKEKQAEILRRLRKASSHPNTQRLMLSPLQVTILAVLAELQGEFPDARWELFQEYYQTIYKRETQRNQDLSPILRDYSDEIEQVHERVGINLQVLNEAAGANDAFLNQAQLASIIRECLRNRFDEGDETLDDLTNQIRTAALERLVFLVSPEGEQIGFEIRSFQEFMAARALTDGSDEQICNRVNAISGFPFWRNVFLFAAGRCVRDRRHLIEFIIGLCTTLNNDPDNPAYMHTLAGSCLALDLLEDMTFHRKRTHSQSLMDSALKLLNSPSDELLHRFTVICQGSVSANLVREKICACIESKRSDEQERGWRVLITLVDFGEQWTEELANELWPKNVQRQIQILESLQGWVGSQNRWIFNKRIELATHLHPFSLIPFPSNDDMPEWLCAFQRIHRRMRSPYYERHILLRINNEVAPSLALQFTPIPEFDDDWREIQQMPPPRGTWAAIVAAARFIQNPTKESLASELATLATDGLVDVDENHQWWTYCLPWPLAICLNAAKRGEDLGKLSDAARGGQYGDRTEWLAVQEKWISNGITIDDLERAVQLDRAEWPLESTWMSLCGSLRRVSKTTGDIAADVQQMIELYDKIPAAKQRETLEVMIAIGLFEMRQTSRFEGAALEICPRPQSVKAWLKKCPRNSAQLCLERIIPWPKPLSLEWLDMLDDLGRSSYIGRVAPQRLKGRETHPDFLSELINSYINQPSRTGILAWIRALVSIVECNQRIPKELLWPVGDESENVRKDLLSLLLFWGDLSVSEARELSVLTKELCETHQSSRSGFPSLRILFPHWDHEWAMTFVISLIENTSVENERLRWECHEWLQHHLSRRRSPLHDIKVTRELGINELT